MTPEEQLVGRGEVLELEDHRVQVVTATYDPNPPEASYRGPAPVGFTYLQLLLRFEGIPEDRGVESLRFTSVLQINYPECEDAYAEHWDEVTGCLSATGSPDTTFYQTAEQLLAGPYEDEDVFDPGVPYFATYFYTVVEDMLPTDLELCYVPSALHHGPTTAERCIPIELTS